MLVENEKKKILLIFMN